MDPNESIINVTAETEIIHYVKLIAVKKELSRMRRLYRYQFYLTDIDST